VTASSHKDAYLKLSNRLDKSVGEIQALSHSIEKKEVSGEFVTSNSGDRDEFEPWLVLLRNGIRDITSTIKESIKGTKGERIEKEKIEAITNRWMIFVFASILIISLLSAFIFLTDSIEKNDDAVYKFYFPIITGVFGLLGGYGWGKSKDSS
jgi:hypothetical protein